MSAELLEAIAAELENDAPRLVYADSLTEQHDARGEFIVLQCQAARLPAGDPQRERLLGKAELLLEEHRTVWSPLGLEHWEFERGFPAALRRLTVRTLREHEKALEAVFTLRALEVHFGTPRPEDLAGLAQLPLLQRLTSLSFNWHAPPAVVLELLTSPWIVKLQRLQLSWEMLPLQVWQVLGRAESFARQIPELDLMLADARDEFVQLLDPAPWPKLRWLRLANGRLGTRGCELLAQPGLFPALTHLDLSWNRIGKRGAALLAKSALIHQLEELDLSHCQIGDEGCAELAAARPRALRSLALRNSRVSAKGLAMVRAVLPEAELSV